ncbi:LytR C-terminal domain-containing protein [Arthrobacter sp. MA-N2]|uniref:LytR C-terminal domain-containing protein n=1 Tax=Arthrobacter sp. MA-N2 TaxID=1101188 RepID=UPI0009DDBD95|nr:LytR C-terminal domain-containing protein [Arthrobacter sp. MA-N2]
MVNETIPEEQVAVPDNANPRKRRNHPNRQKDPTILHGHRVVTGPELRATFVDSPGPESHPGWFSRRLLHGIVLALLIGLIVAGLVGAWAVMNGVIRFPSALASSAPAAVCPTTVFDYTPNNKIQVNVYNAAGRSGLAKNVADQLKARGYIVGSVDNSTTSYTGSAMVVSGSSGEAAAFNIQRNVPNTDFFQDQRADASVDIILAPGFSALVPAELVDNTPGKLSCPRQDQRIADNSKLPVLPPPTP